MIRPGSRTIVLPLIAVCLLVLGACSATMPRAAVTDATPVWSDGNGYVWLEPAENGARNDHPAGIPADVLRESLSALRMETRPGERQDHALSAFAGDEVLTEGMLERLAEPLSQALARARPDQDVVFSVRGFRSSTWSSYVGRDVVTSARLFHDDLGLQLVVGEINTELDTDYRYARGPEAVATGQVPVPHGSRGRAASGRWQLLEAAGIQRHHGNGQPRHDWVRIDPSATLVGIRPDAATPAPVTDEYGTRERLRLLREMYEEGLIPEDVYRRRVEQIAEEI